MKILDIIKESYWSPGYNINHFEPSGLSFTSVKKDDEHVDYFVTAANGKRIATYNLWNCVGTVFMWSELKAPDKAHLFKLMGIIPLIVKDYMEKSYYAESTYPDEFNIDLGNAITSKRFNDVDYQYYVKLILGFDYRIRSSSDTFRMMPIKQPKAPTNAG